jgi:hypothetical protein
VTRYLCATCGFSEEWMRRVSVNIQIFAGPNSDFRSKLSRNVAFGQSRSNGNILQNWRRANPPCFVRSKSVGIAHQSPETPSIVGRRQLIRFALRDGDPFTIFGMLETLDFRTRESAELVFSFEMLRSRRFPADDLSAWTRRATNYLGGVLDDRFTRLAT